MNVKLYTPKNEIPTEASILPGTGFVLPDLRMGWRFDFSKHSKGKDTFTYVLVTKSDTKRIQGCLIYKMRNKNEPYMAYLEVAPHNKGNNKEFKDVAGCLIAFACRLSFN